MPSTSRAARNKVHSITSHCRYIFYNTGICQPYNSSAINMSNSTRRWSVLRQVASLNIVTVNSFAQLKRFFIEVYHIDLSTIIVFFQNTGMNLILWKKFAFEARYKQSILILKTLAMMLKKNILVHSCLLRFLTWDLSRSGNSTLFSDSDCLSLLWWAQKGKKVNSLCSIH